MPKPIFATCYPGEIAKLLGPEEWPEAVKKELANLSASTVPGIRTLGRLQHLCAKHDLASSLHIVLDGITRPIAKARSRSAGAFLRSDADVWVTVDDDIEVDTRVLANLVSVARITEAVVAAPYLLKAYAPRKEVRLSYRKAVGDVLVNRVVVADGAPVRCARADRIGFGIVAIARHAVELLDGMVPRVNEDGESFPALFQDAVEGHAWVTEDFFFSSLCEKAHIPIRLLLEHPVWHAGLSMQLSDKLEVQLDAETCKLLEARERTA